MATKRPADREHRHVDEFLEGRLGPGQTTRLERHLEGCPACRSRLDAASADEAFWAEATAFLRDDPLDAEARDLGLADAGGFARGPAPGDRPEVHRVGEYFDPTDDPRMLGRFGGYEVAGIVGGGGMGVVLKGYEPALDRFVAIKVLAPHLAASGAARARFAREARAAAAVIHENVVAIHRVAESGGLPYLVMPYLAGESLQRRLDERGPLGVLEALRIGAQVAAGLAAAHAQGLVHRDVKPGNVLLDRGVERVMLTDFGLARAADDASLTRSGVIAGTPQFMSPEQARGEPVDHRSDLFSLGSLLYAMLTGRPPFRAESAFGVLRRITDTEPRPLRDAAPEVPGWLCGLVGRLMAKRPEDRFGSAGEVAELLGRWIAHLQQPTTVPAPERVGRTSRDGRRIGRRGRLVAAVGASVLGLALAAAFFRGAAGPVPGGAGTGAADSPAAGARPPRGPDSRPGAAAGGSPKAFPAPEEVGGDWTAPRLTGRPDPWDQAAGEVTRRLDDLSVRLSKDLPPPEETAPGPPPGR